MRRMFQVYLTQYLRALEDNEEEDDQGGDANQMLDDDDENGGNDNMSDDDDDDSDDEDNLQSLLSLPGRRTSTRLSTRSAQSRLREEEKEKQFQDKLSELLKELNEHDIAQTIRAHTGQYCKNSDPVEKFEKINYYSGVNYTQKKGLVYQLHRRKIGNCTNGALHRNAALTSPSSMPSIASRFLPSLNRGPIGKSEAYMFCGQFSLDGKFFMSASQDQVIRIYDVNTILLKKSTISTSSKPTNDSQTSSRMEDDDTWLDSEDDEENSRNDLTNQTGFGNNSTVKHIREIHARDVGWSIIDCNPSPDNRLLVYSSWSPYIHLATFAPQDYDPNEDIEKRLKYVEKHEQLYLNPGNYRFCAFAVRFSPDGKEILAGSNDDHLYIYDLEKNVRTEKIHAHKSDINTVCYAGESCPNLFYSGSDDGLCKVWDRRQCSTSSSTPVGILAGHSDGITCVTSKGDGRYFISNGKDQTCKLWDIRKMADSAPQIPRASNLWDYRYEAAPSRHARVIHPRDQSLMTYTGHHVLQTLIRCYFSPMSTTGQQYIYTGSHDGIVYIFDILTGEIVKRLYGHAHIVRDVNWHPYLPVLFSSSWDGTCLMWSHNNLN